MSDIIAADQLRLLVERRERLEEEKRGLQDDIKDLNGEVKSLGYDLKAFNAVIKLRAMEKHTRDEMEAILEVYKAALGLD